MIQSIFAEFKSDINRALRCIREKADTRRRTLHQVNVSLGVCIMLKPTHSGLKIGIKTLNFNNSTNFVVFIKFYAKMKG